MAVHVRLTIDTKTGEVRLFEIDQDDVEGGAAHERAHDREAARIARVFAVLCDGRTGPALL